MWTIDNLIGAKEIFNGKKLSWKSRTPTELRWCLDPFSQGLKFVLPPPLSLSSPLPPDAAPLLLQPALPLPFLSLDLERRPMDVTPSEESSAGADLTWPLLAARPCSPARRAVVAAPRCRRMTSRSLATTTVNGARAPSLSLSPLWRRPLLFFHARVEPAGSGGQCRGPSRSRSATSGSWERWVCGPLPAVRWPARRRPWACRRRRMGSSLAAAAARVEAKDDTARPWLPVRYAGSAGALAVTGAAGAARRSAAVTATAECSGWRWKKRGGGVACTGAYVRQRRVALPLGLAEGGAGCRGEREYPRRCGPRVEMGIN
jgi:hypothetical protein